MTARSRPVRFLRLLAVLTVLGLALMFLFGPYLADRASNKVLVPGPYPVPEEARALHARLAVSDLHADTLLWDRDLVERGTHGHVDIPRLIEANVTLQGFFLVTHTPRGLNIHRNEDTTDNITLLSVFQRWPVATWTSRKARALHQAGRLRDAAARSGGKLTLITSRAELAAYRERRAREPGITAGFLGVEGAHCLDGDLNALDELFAAGIRVVAPTHFHDNFLGGSASGVTRGGLTAAGRDLITRLEAKRMLVDLAHASPALIQDVLAMAKRPVIVSHTGVRGTCDNPRNLSDQELAGIARTGGVAGIAFFKTAACGNEFTDIVRAIKHAAKVMGPEHVALGSDFDGAVLTRTDVTGLPLLTAALLQAGFTEQQIAGIMGGNVLRVLGEHLP